MRVGIIYPVPEPLAPANWSGTPHGLASGLVGCGVDVVPIGVKIPHGLHELVAILSRATGRRGAVADRMQVRQWARTRALKSALAQHPTLDAVIAMGTEMYDLAAVLEGSVPCATYDDGTLLQMYRDPNSDIRQSRFPQRHVARWIERQSASTRAATVCCVSTNWAARSYEDDYGIPSGQLAVVGMGHRPRLAAPGVIRDWSRPRFLFVGVEWRRKNGASVVRAFEEVRKRVPEATLDLVGNHPEIDAPGVNGHGFLARGDASAQLKLDRLYAAANCFVLPSKFDPSPIAYLEAASAGLPVIATSRGGAGELINDGAIVVDPGDSKALVDAMLALADRSAAQSMGAAAARNAAASSWSDVAGRIVKALGLTSGPVRSGRTGEYSDV